MARFQDQELAEQWFDVIVEAAEVAREVDADAQGTSWFKPVVGLAEIDPVLFNIATDALDTRAENGEGPRGFRQRTQTLVSHWRAIRSDIQARSLTANDLNAALGTITDDIGIDRSKLASRYIAHLFNTHDMTGLRSFAEVDAPTDGPPSLPGARMRVLGAIAANATDGPFEHLITPDDGNPEWAKMLRQAVYQIGEIGTDSGFSDTDLWIASWPSEPVDRVLTAAYDELAKDEVVQQLATRLFQFSTRVSAVTRQAYEDRGIADAPSLVDQVSQIMTDGDPLSLRSFMTAAIERFDLNSLSGPKSGMFVIDGEISGGFARLWQDLGDEGVGAGVVRSAFGYPTRDDIPGMLVAGAIESGDNDALERLINETLADTRPDIETAHLRVAAAVAAQHLDSPDDVEALLGGKYSDPQARATVALLVREGTTSGTERDVAHVLDLWTTARDRNLASAVRTATPGIDDDDPGLTVEPVVSPEPGAPTAVQRAQDARAAEYLGLAGELSDEVEPGATNGENPHDILTDRHAPDELSAAVDAGELDEAAGLTAPELNAI